ncbi:FtsQ-type POTRA domain-containing protein [Gracilibacillus sp. S3-1-1]|uniref:FtsQ-type POTRA domain-containing protein n=1 Tax=Gracilibacillus pellucidus TaxID=3095368 RepID=A0ACC6M228_9BACI|nr:FtsQ-type POTRA domain-containing protein [Gracilibacillus sp. S3-1-1]MDX8044930.1 FtsQ-type POTRA domain-containing protein [Gracilibacillus sp. S3-1-1]
MVQKRVVSIEDRIPKLKQERRKKANRKLIFYLLIFFVLVFIVIYLQSPMSYVKNITVNGLQFLPEEEIIEQSEIEEPVNFWRVKTKELEDNIMTHPQVKEAEVSKSFPNTIVMDVQELTHVAYVELDGKINPLLENGDVLHELKSSDIHGDVPILKGFKDNNYLHEIAEELGNLSPYISALISEAYWEPTESNPYRITLYMTDGQEVESTIRNLAHHLDSYPSIASQLDNDQEGIIKIDQSGAVFTPYEVEKEEEEKIENDHEE